MFVVDDEPLQGMSDALSAHHDRRQSQTWGGATFRAAPGLEIRHNVIDASNGANYSGGSSYSPGLPLAPSSSGLAFDWNKINPVHIVQSAFKGGSKLISSFMDGGPIRRFAKDLLQNEKLQKTIMAAYPGYAAYIAAVGSAARGDTLDKILRTWTAETVVLVGKCIQIFFGKNSVKGLDEIAKYIDPETLKKLKTSSEVMGKYYENKYKKAVFNTLALTADNVKALKSVGIDVKRMATSQLIDVLTKADQKKAALIGSTLTPEFYQLVAGALPKETLVAVYSGLVGAQERLRVKAIIDEHERAIRERAAYAKSHPIAVAPITQTRAPVVFAPPPAPVHTSPAVIAALRNRITQNLAARKLLDGAVEQPKTSDSLATLLEQAAKQSTRPREVEQVGSLASRFFV